MTSILDTRAHQSIRDDWESIEPPMENDTHRDQLYLLIACLRWWWRDRTDAYITGNSTIFFSPNEKITEKMRGPDLFVVLGVNPRPRGSWMLWKEDYKYPNLIIELLSDSTAKEDHTTKKELYQNTFKTPEYFWFHPETLEFQGFRLRGSQYQPINSTEQGWRWSEQLGLYLGVVDKQLRYITSEGELVPTPMERAELASREAELANREAEQADKRAEQAEQEIERLRQQLRDSGLDP